MKEERAKLKIFPTLIMVFSFLFLLSLFIFLIKFTVEASGGSSFYLYSPDGTGKEKKADVAPIIDYVKPDRNNGESDSAYTERISHPHFLSDANEEGDRIVEFYAAWCGYVSKVSLFFFHAFGVKLIGSVL